MAIKNTSSVTSWVRNEIYEKMQADKNQQGISMQKLATQIIEAHYQNHNEVVTQTQIESIKNKFRLQTLFDLLDKNTFEGSKPYRQLVEEELEKFMHS